MLKYVFPNGIQWLLLCVLSVSSIQAQEAFEVSVNRNPVRTGEQVQLTFTIKNLQRRIDGPQIQGLKLLYGPSTSNSTSIVNGARSSEVAYTYTYQVTSKTNVRIPAFELNGTKGTLKSDPFVLRVSARGAKPSGPNSGDLGTVACIIEASKRTVFIGEPIVISFKIFNRANNLDVRKFNIPETPGFWKEEVDIPEPRWEPQVISGKRYNVATVKKLVLFPQQTGSLVIEGFDLVGYMRTSFFNGQNVTAAADPVKIEVKPLPEPIPSSFLGAFAQFRVAAKQTGETCRTNEAITYDLTFSGQGNIKFIQEPKLSWPGEFEVFDPEVIDRINVNENGESGSRTFRYVVIPRAPGDFTLPMPKGSWFNTKTRSYVDLESKELKLTVAVNTAEGANTVNYNSKTDIQVLNQDINFIHSDWKGPCLPRQRWDNRGQWASGMLAVGPLVLGVSFLLRRRRDEEERNPKGAKKRRAGNAVRKELREAKSLINVSEFYPALGRGLEAYLLSKLEWNASQMQRSNLLNELAMRVPSQTEDWKAMLDTLDMARYAPGQVPAPAELLSTAERLVDATEKEWNA